jgi:mannose-1-phosphate guanylyltransferase
MLQMWLQEEIMSSTDTNTWAVVLAGGDGFRLRRLTSDAPGTTVPKQFCTLDGGASLIEMALARAERLVPTDRMLVSVTDSHRVWWQDDLILLPPDNIVRQPSNRGTLAGVLLPLIEVFVRDPAARVIVVPSDHFVADEVVIETAARCALSHTKEHPEHVVLLGVQPEVCDPDYGWIVPDTGSGEDPRRVASFFEKPDRDTARRLYDEGGLLNTFIFAGRVWRLIELCEALEPILFWSLRLARWHRFGVPGGSLPEAYQQLPTGDFSRDILQRISETLLVQKVPPCGWSDLGTPERIALWADKNLSPSREFPSHVSTRPILTEALLEQVTVGR